MTLPDPACRGCAVRDRIEQNLRSQLTTLQREAETSERWLRAWEQLVFDLGDLIHRVGLRRKGRRFATVVELNNVLRKQADQGVRP